MSTHVAPRHAVRRPGGPPRSRRRRTISATLLFTVGALLCAAVSLHSDFDSGRTFGWDVGTPAGVGLGRLAQHGVADSQPTDSSSSTRWAAVLRRLDSRRDEAWRSGRLEDLSRAFVVGRKPWYADRAALAAYLARGYTVASARMRFWDPRVLTRTAYTVRLRVVDRLSQVSVRAPSGALTRLPRDRPTRHLIALRHTPDGWRISAIHAA
jgi:hypothetical protein